MSLLGEILESHTILQLFTHVTAECRTADSSQASLYRIVHRPEKKDSDIVIVILFVRECMARHVMMLGLLTTTDVFESFSTIECAEIKDRWRKRYRHGCT